MRHQSRTEAGPPSKARAKGQGERMSRRAVVEAGGDGTPPVVDEVGPVQVGPLAVDAQPEAEAAQDLAAAAAQAGAGDTDALAMPGEAPADGARSKDTGELYGVRTPHAADTELSAPEHLDSFEG